MDSRVQCVTVMISCPHCGFLGEYGDFPHHPEMAFSDIIVQSFSGPAALLVPILVCPNCKGTEVPGQYLKVQ